MSLGLEITSAVERALGPDDLVPTVPRPTLQRLRDRHHALARALAIGMTHGDAALTVGLAPETVSTLVADPTFKELRRFYEADSQRVIRTMHERLAGISADAIDLLQERIEETPDKVSTPQLLEIAKFGADRSGFGPKTVQDVNVTIGLAERMAAARERAVALRRSPIIDETATELPIERAAE